MNVSILEAAEEEQVGASRYDVIEANRAIAADFLQEFERAIGLLRKFPSQWASRITRG